MNSDNIKPPHGAETIGWVDFLRVLAVFLVVLAHSCDAFTGSFDTDRTAFLSGVTIGSLTRPCVPLFVMMTGLLLLPRSADVSLSGFYRKRIGRIMVPLVFWSLALPLAFTGYFSTLGAASANPMLTPADYTASTLLNRLWTWIFNFNFDTVPLWYLYMLIGLYLIMPMLASWLSRASRRDVRLLLILWGVSLCLPYLQMLAPLVGYKGNWGNMGLLGVCDWNAFGTFYYLSGFAGYMVLAYYLTRWPLTWSWGRTLAVCVPMFIIGYAITAGGMVKFQEWWPGNYAYLEIIWLFCGLNVFMMTLPVFIVVQKANCRPSPLLRTLARLGFGVYLCHFIFVYMAYDLFDIAGLAPWARILCGAVVASVASLALCWILDRWRPTRRLIA